MICKYCGKKIPDDASYCPSCGKRTASHMRAEDRDEDIDDYEYEESKGKRRIKTLVSIIAAALVVVAAFIVIMVVAKPYIGEDTSDETAQTEEVEYSESPETMYVSAEDWTVIRSGPAQDSEAIHILINGQEVQVEKIEDGWAYLFADGVPGWCSTDYLTGEKADTEQKESAKVSDDDKGKLVEPSVLIETGYHWVINSEGGLNLRCGPGQEYDILMVVPYEAEVAEEGRDGDWLYVKHDGQYGWINLEYITPVRGE